MDEYVTTKEAAEILGVSPVRARALLAPPDRQEQLPNRAWRAYYLRVRVIELREERRNAPAPVLGLRKCRRCGKKFHPKDLTSGKCPHCHAYCYMRNLLYRGDPCAHDADLSRLDAIASALEELRSEYGNSKCDDLF